MTTVRSGHVVSIEPLGDENTIDTAQAMALLGFSCSKSFYNTPMEEIQEAFAQKVKEAHSGVNKQSNLKHKETTKAKLRKLNEALQFLVHKREKSETLAAWKRSGKKTKNLLKAVNGFQLGEYLSRTTKRA